MLSPQTLGQQKLFFYLVVLFVSRLLSSRNGHYGRRTGFLLPQADFLPAQAVLHYRGKIFLPLFFSRITDLYQRRRSGHAPSRQFSGTTAASPSAAYRGYTCFLVFSRFKQEKVSYGENNIGVLRNSMLLLCFLNQISYFDFDAVFKGSEVADF